MAADSGAEFLGVALSIGCACDDLESLELTADRELTPLASTVSDAEGKFSFPAVQGVRVGETPQLNVRVHGSDGQPVDGAAVLRLERGGVTELVRTDGALTQANGKGEFTVENGLADGTFVVTAVLTDDENAHLGLPFHGRELARQPMSGSVEVQVRGGVAPVVEVMLAEAKAVTGQVVDAQGRPVPDVRILASDREPENELKPGRKLRAVQLSMSNMFMMGGPPARPLMEEDAVSDAQGRFGIPGLVGGPFWLVTLKDGLRNDPARLTQVRGRVEGADVKRLT